MYPTKFFILSFLHNCGKNSWMVPFHLIFRPISLVPSFFLPPLSLLLLLISSLLLSSLLLSFLLLSSLFLSFLPLHPSFSFYTTSNKPYFSTIQIRFRSSIFVHRPGFCDVSVCGCKWPPKEGRKEK